jgi:hypothetical protein
MACLPPYTGSTYESESSRNDYDAPRSFMSSCCQSIACGCFAMLIPARRHARSPRFFQKMFEGKTSPSAKLLQIVAMQLIQVRRYSQKLEDDDVPTSA